MEQSNPSSKTEDAVEDLFDRFWQWRLWQSPEFASFCGMHDYDDRLDSIDLKMLRRLTEETQEFLDECGKIEKSKLSKSYAMQLKLMEYECRTFLDGVDCNGWYFPVTNLEGIHQDIHLLLTFVKFNCVEDFKKYIRRLMCYKVQVDHIIEVCRAGIASGYTLPECTVDEVPNQVQILIEAAMDEEDSVFLSPFKNDDVLEDSLREQLITTLRKLMKIDILPAFIKLKRFFVEEYLPNTRSGLGCNNLPNGEAYYQQCLVYHTSTDMTPDEIHQLGLEEVDRITKEIEKLSEAEGYGKDIKKFVDDVQNNKKFFYDNEDDLLDYVKDICDKRIRPKLKTLFKDIPEAEMEIQPTPVGMTAAPSAYYMAGTYDGSRPGIYYIHTAHVHEIPKYEMMALSLHEGEPGHHLQTMHAIQQDGLHSFRQYIEDCKYSRCPSRFSMMTAYIEGWGLYCEYLGEEMGMYETNFEKLGRYFFEIQRAARLVVDTGLHAFNWTLEQAQEYVVEKAFGETMTTFNEVRRYVTWPGQACAYKIGEIKIKDLRKKAAKELGEDFDVRDFHEAILDCGPVPLKVLEEVVDTYIHEIKDGLNEKKHKENDTEITP